MDVDALFASIDRMDPEGFAAFLTEGGTFHMGSYPPAVGRAAVAKFVRGFWTTVESSAHSGVRVYGQGEDRFVEGTVTYGLKNGRTVAVPFLNRFRMEGELIAEYLIYLDPTPVAEAMALSDVEAL